MPLKCNWIETYKNKNGKYIFVYIVSGSDSEKEDFKIKQGVYYRETPEDRKSTRLNSSH